MNDACTVAQTENLTEALRYIYRDVAAMKDYVTRPAIPRARLERALNCFTTAKNPCFKFGLEKSDTVDTVVFLRIFICAMRGEFASDVMAMKKLRRETQLEWSGVWDRLAPEGFDRGDGWILGFDEWS